MSAKSAAKLQGLHNHLQENEQPLLNVPGLWDNGQQKQSVACDIVLTNQRLLGYYFVSFPRERLFLDALPLSTIRAVTLRQKNFEPVFRELMVSTGERRVYIRSARKKIELLNTALHDVIEHDLVETTTTSEALTADQPASRNTIYAREEIRRPLENTPLQITILFMGGLCLEVLGFLLWSSTHSAQIGAPLLVAGFVSWLAAMFLRTKHQ